MSVLITICARGGSKGVKNKNIKMLNGKPLIAYTIQQALAWGKADDIVISTDSKEIADVAISCGAKAPFLRPAELATDSAPKFPVIRHAFNESERIYGRHYDYVIDLDPTSPIRKTTDIDNCYNMFQSHRPLTLFSVVKARKNPYFNMVEEDSDGFAKICKKPDSTVFCRQSAPAVYDMNASIYMFDREFLLDENNRSVFSGRTKIYVMDDESAFDIDREIDLNIVEYLIKEGRLGL